MALLSGLQTSLTGMKVAQQQLDIIGRNVANVDTEGYHPQDGGAKNVVLAGQTPASPSAILPAPSTKACCGVFWRQTMPMVRPTAKPVSEQDGNPARHAGRR